MTDFELYPWQLEPKLAPAFWGGDRLVRDYDKRGDPTHTPLALGHPWFTAGLGVDGVCALGSSRVV